jgi:hypothetical protein
MTDTEPKRDKTIKIRVSQEELATLQMHCTRSELARWMRETCLNPGQTDLVRDLRGSTADRDFLRQLVSIGNNLNQIARRVNTAEWGPAERVQVLAALAGIERELAGVRALHK